MTVPGVPPPLEADDSPPRAVLRAGRRRWQRRLFTIIFEHDTFAGRLFDLSLLAMIGLSVLAVMLESVDGIRQRHGNLLYGAEWLFTGLFTVEYGLRLACVRRPVRYATSFFGVVDLLAVLPTYISLLVPGAQGLATVRALRLLRIFRILKLTQFVNEAAVLRVVLWQSREKIIVFLMTVVIVACIIGAMMYVVEGDENAAFSSIPQSIYWAIVTMATVGYGDIVPLSPLGKFLAVVLIVFGYSMIVVPTGIVTAEFAGARNRMDREAADRRCSACGKAGHDADATYCKYCGEGL